MAAGSASSCTYLTIISSDALSMHFSITLDENFCMESIATCRTTKGLREEQSVSFYCSYRFGLLISSHLISIHLISASPAGRQATP